MIVSIKEINNNNNNNNNNNKSYSHTQSKQWVNKMFYDQSVFLHFSVSIIKLFLPPFL